MGVVYKARALRLDRIVALKMLLAGSHAGPKERARFAHEAAAVAQLQHPHIVALYDAGQCGDLFYFTLEFVAGGSLAHRLDGAPLPPMAAARLVEAAARGAQHAHERGIVHRDLKPGNILLQQIERGRMTNETTGSADSVSCVPSFVPKITDFGLAKNVDVETALTSTGAVFGTPSYMAPEQALGASKDVGAAADVYALGAILYECLTGRPPFRGPTPTETLLQVVQDEPVPPSRLQRAMPRDLETICLKCLRKAARERYASALDLAEDLRRFQAGEPIQARPVGRFERLLKWCRRHPAVAALSLALVLLVLIAGSLLTWQWREAVTTLADLRHEKIARAHRQVAALADAAPARVPAILEELAADRNETLALLQSSYEQEKDEGRRMRFALALVPVETEAVRAPLTDWMLRAEDPAEVLLAREALRPYRALLIASLWAKSEQAGTPPEMRFRALVALAAYDPDNSRWQKAGPEVVAHLLWSNPLHRALWADALRPLGQSLLAPLTEASYFPLKAGTKWHYQMVNYKGEKEERTHQIVKIEQIDGQPLARLEGSSRGDLVTTEHLSSTAKGVFRHRFNGIDVIPPLCLLKFPIKLGESWESALKIGQERGRAICRVGAEEVAVPAGHYKTITAQISVFDQLGSTQVETRYWFAPGIGVVKQTVVIPPPREYVGFVGVNTLGTAGLTLNAGPLVATAYVFPVARTTTLALERFEEGK
jgi:hypothetical protein